MENCRSFTWVALGAHFVLGGLAFGQKVDPSQFCRDLRTQIPVVREQSQSYDDERRKPGPVQTAPWYLAKGGVIAVPEDTPLRAIPQNLFSSGKVTPLGGSVTNGRMLNISDAVWMIGSSCSSAPDDYRRGLVTINMDFVTDRKFELVRNGNTGVSAFLFQVRVPLQELISLPGKDLDDYLSILLADNPPGAKGSGSVRLGDSQQRVKEMLGPPENVFDLGSKVIYSYRSIKITFIDGKVSDVQ